jgi:hypothetical protein
MIRITVTELRRSTPLAVAALLSLVSVAALATSFDIWQGRWSQYSYNHTAATFVLVPLALAGGAMFGRREKRTRVDELTASTGRPRWQRTAPAAAALAIAVTVAHLLVFAAGAVVVESTATYLNWGALLVPLTDVVILTGAAWLGLAAGRAWSSPLLPPALAVVTLAGLVGLSEVHGVFSRLSLIAQPPWYDWEAVTGRTLLGHLALGAGLAVAGLLLVAGASWRPRVTALAVAAAALVAATVVPAGRYYVDPEAPRLVCASGTPQVCVTEVHEFALAEAAPQVRRVLTLLAKLPGAPRRAVEWRADGVGRAGIEPAGVRTAPGTLQFDLGLEGLHPDPHLTERLLAAPRTWGQQCPGAVSDTAWAALGAWLLGTDSITFDGAEIEQARAQVRDAVHKLRALPQAVQIQRVTAMRAAGADCDADLLPILTGEPHS